VVAKGLGQSIACSSAGARRHAQSSPLPRLSHERRITFSLSMLGVADAAGVITSLALQRLRTAVLGAAVLT
jgi:hypothetical protein